MRTFKNMLLFGVLLLIMGIMFNSCSDENMDPDPQDPDPVDPCENQMNLEVDDIIHSFTDQSTGSFQVNVSGGNGDIEFSIDGDNFSTDNSFEDLSAGTYTVEVVDDSSCTNSINVQVMEYPERSFSADVMPIIETNCRISGCHGDQAGIPTWENYTVISANANRIKQRVTEGSMPPPSSGQSLTEGEITIIQNWVDTGAPDN